MQIQRLEKNYGIAHYNVWFENAPDRFHMSACQHVTTQEVINGFS